MAANDSARSGSQHRCGLHSQRLDQLSWPRHPRVLQQRHQRIAAGLLLATSAVVASAEVRSALPEFEAVHFEYEAHAGCPSRDEFIASVRARTSRLQLTEAPAGQALKVQITKSENGKSVGSLGVQQHGRKTTRHISSDSCEAVARALVLTTVLSVYPESAAAAPVPQSESPLQLESPPLPPPHPGPIASRLDAYSIRERPNGHDSKMAPAWKLAAGGVISNPLAPGFVWGLSLGIEAEWASSSVVAVSTRLLGNYARAVRTVHEGRATFTWGVVGIDVCPLRFGGAELSLRSCFAGFGGFLEGEGEGFENSRAKMRSWWSLAALLRARQRLFGDLGLELWAGAMAPLVRRSFVVDGPTETVAESPSVSVLGGLSVVGTLL